MVDAVSLVLSAVVMASDTLMYNDDDDDDDDDTRSLLLLLRFDPTAILIGWFVIPKCDDNILVLRITGTVGCNNATTTPSGTP